MSLPIPEGQNKPGLVRTVDNHQITLLQAQHGLPLFALRVIPTMKADYKHYMQLLKNSGSQPLHIDQAWNRDIDALPDIKVTSQLGEDVLKDFSLGLFIDYLVYKKDPVVLGMLDKSPIDDRTLRGCVFTSNGTDYFVVNLVEREGVLRMSSVDHLSSAGRLIAAENFANFPEVGKSTAKLLGMLEEKKQYQLISDVEEYLERMIVSETKRVEDEEERAILEREYEVLQVYLEQLRYQQRRGLPLAG